MKKKDEENCRIGKAIAGSEMKERKKEKRNEKQKLEKRREMSRIIELHWSPVSERVTFKILVTVFKCLSGTAPGYLSSCLSLHKPRRANLRSASDTTQLNQHSTIRTLQCASNRTFTYVAPSLWNNLSMSMRTCDSLQVFKKSVKTYLYPM